MRGRGFWQSRPKNNGKAVKRITRKPNRSLSYACSGPIILALGDEDYGDDSLATCCAGCDRHMVFGSHVRHVGVAID